jgi:hypothetical protein
MKSQLEGSGLKWLCGLVALCSVVWMTGCDDLEDEKNFDYVPPSGKGALIVDNLSPTDVNVYVDGGSVGRVGDDDDKPFNLQPGVHRVVLDEEDGGRRWSSDLDILDGRLTILRVTLDTGDFNDYKVDVEFD